MRLKFLKLDSTQLLEKCRKGDQRAQRLLFEKYSDLMLGVCRRYLSNHHAAEDAMIRGFFKVFKNLKKLEDDKAFEGWMRRIMANECLMDIRKQKRMPIDDLDDAPISGIKPEVFHRLNAENILALIEHLPDGYRTIFNLYVIEGYKHKEIADMLDISINTSKSQLIMARKRLQEQLKSLNFIQKEVGG